MHTLIESPTIPNLEGVKAKQKATWESGDFGQIARTIENVAEEFMARQLLRSGARVLDAACGTGNLAVIAARHGCVVTGIDIASNLIEQAKLVGTDVKGVIVTGSGHWLIDEAPKQVIPALVEFIN